MQPLTVLPQTPSSVEWNQDAINHAAASVIYKDRRSPNTGDLNVLTVKSLGQLRKLLCFQKMADFR